ncbi:hypothetical protein A1355_09585 [Methylomonas koyamae]|uniref:Uncharacterized protein n=1 Tax=Methylomonas koyamae TaxID=702114 RepID=A0A177NFW2_9GAMM|nr:hypothetical protein A1355_09585 [Methylomonas koyamae]
MAANLSSDCAFDTNSLAFVSVRSTVTGKACAPCDTDSTRPAVSPVALACSFSAMLMLSTDIATWL